MATVKEVLLLLVDVSPLMHRHLEPAGSALLTAVASKIINAKGAEVAVVFSGTDGTCNVPHQNCIDRDPDDNAQYLHITVAHALQKPRASDYLPTLKSLPRGGARSDWVDGVTVCMDMVARAGLERTIEKVPKKLVVISNFLDKVTAPDEDFVSMLVDSLHSHNTSLEIVCLDDPTDPPSEYKAANVALLHEFVAQVGGRLRAIATSSELLGVFQTKEVLVRNMYAGELHIGGKLKIQVGVYNKTQIQRPPSLSSYSDKSSAADATHAVTRDTTHKLALTDEDVPPQDRITAHRYGKQLVPVDEAQALELKYQPGRAFEVIGFVDREQVPRHRYLVDTWVVVPHVDSAKDKVTKANVCTVNADSATAISALVLAMEKLEKFAVVRWARTKSSSPMLGVLSPWAATGGSRQPDCFVLNVLPYAEDLRTYAFPKLGDLPDSKPNAEQKQAVRALVKSMDLMAGGERLKPEETSNPLLQRMYLTLANKAIDPAYVIPAQDELVNVTFDPQLQAFGPDAAAAVSAMEAAFTTVPVPTKRGRDEGDGADAAAKRSRLSEGGPGGGLGAEARPAVTTAEPVEEFLEALRRLAPGEVADGPFAEMRSVIHELASTSVAHRLLAKASSCVAELRRAAGLHGRPDDFNALLLEVEQRAAAGEAGEYPDLLRALVDAGVAPLGVDEAPASSTSTADAVAWLERHRSGGAVKPEAAAPPAEAAAVEDEFEGME